MLKLSCMFEDGCLFYTLANFYREQSNLKVKNKNSCEQEANDWA